MANNYKELIEYILNRINNPVKVLRAIDHSLFQSRNNTTKKAVITGITDQYGSYLADFY